MFQLNYRRDTCILDPESLNLVLLQGIREDVMETLNMLSGGDICQMTYDDIKTIFKNDSRVAKKRGRSNQCLVNSSPSTSTVK